MAERAPVRAILSQVVVLLAAMALTQPAWAAHDTIFFSRSFPGSIPAYFEVTVDSSGKAVYREAPEEEPLEFEISASEVAQVFEHARKLDFFQKDVASNRKVAFTGDKILRYEGANGTRAEVQFNHTEEPDARSLVTWFHRVSETERHLIELERASRFDRLGVNKMLLMFQISFDKNRIIAPQQFLPILNQIANDKKIMHIARSRAASLVERIQKEQAVTADK